MRTIFFLLIVAMVLTGCKAFMHGYTENKSLNSYTLVTGDKKNFGDKRIKYNKGFHKNSELVNFLNWRGDPNFIYEYKTPAKCRGIKLFYINADSVFVFEEPKKGNLHPVLKEYRPMDDYERLTFQKLKENKQQSIKP
jgi:hypothetical protein